MQRIAMISSLFVLLFIIKLKLKCAANGFNYFNTIFRCTSTNNQTVKNDYLFIIKKFLLCNLFLHSIITNCIPLFNYNEVYASFNHK